MTPAAYLVILACVINEAPSVYPYKGLQSFAVGYKLKSFEPTEFKARFGVFFFLASRLYMSAIKVPRAL